MPINRRRRLLGHFFQGAQQSATWRIQVRAVEFGIDHVLRVIADVGYRDTVGPHEEPRIVEVFFDAEAALVHERMVSRAKQEQVVERGLTAVGPVLDVVAVEEAPVPAAGEAAAVPVSCPYGALDGLRYGAGLAADAERFTLFILGQDDGVAVATQAFH